MKKSELKQIIKEEIFKLINEFDERGKELYKKYEKSSTSTLWKEVDSPYVNKKQISLSKLLSITGMTLDELKELSRYDDSGLSLHINEKTDTVTEFNNQ